MPGTGGVGQLEEPTPEWTLPAAWWSFNGAADGGGKAAKLGGAAQEPSLAGS